MTVEERAFRSALAATIRAEFAAAQLVPAHVAPGLGIHYAKLRRSLTGERDITVYELRLIAEALGFPDTELVHRALERMERMERTTREA